MPDKPRIKIGTYCGYTCEGYGLVAWGLTLTDAYAFWLNAARELYLQASKIAAQTSARETS